ncbi:MAG: CDP-alcohol phosphatidyltransferase family protein [Spirochaetes bacterium]|nr:CDP-alcohol phosphatidyltransferase family protein [Spirochaetota bacterium]
MTSRGHRWTLRDLRSSLPIAKHRADAYWTRWVLRPLSYPVSWFFLRWGWSANAVSYLSALVALLGGFLLSWPYPRLQVTGAILLNLFAVLDCADGNIARVTGTTGPWGAWADALGGYVAYMAVLLGAGMAAEVTSITHPSILFSIPEVFWPQGGWVLLGGLAASANLLMRLTYQQYRTLQIQRNASTRVEDVESDGVESISAETEVKPGPGASEISSEKWISENLGVTGLLMPAVLLGVLTNTICCVVLFYTVLYTGGALWSVLRLARKVEGWKPSS